MLGRGGGATGLRDLGPPCLSPCRLLGPSSCPRGTDMSAVTAGAIRSWRLRANRMTRG